MNELTEIISTATGAIEHRYFHLNIDGSDPIYRERVYCYELYHQMRLRWPPHSPYYLNGEIDKAAHPILQELGADYAKPDLLVHQPGYMSGNHAIIEVKTSQAQNAGIRKDLETLSLFINKVRYERAIYLIYGHGATEKIVARIQRSASEIVELAPIKLWLHQEAGQRATHNITLQRTY
jgi:hypothetical protein